MMEQPLHLAARIGRLDFCQLIVENIVNNNPENNNGVTPLHNAVRYGHLDICRLMIVDKNPANNYGWTLHVAAFNGHLDICRLIIENVDNINPVDDKGRTLKDL